jgi:hypothetical protein
MAKEKVKAAELAASSLAVSRRTPGAGIRSSTSGPGMRSSVSGPIARSSPSGAGMRGSPSGPVARSSPTGPGIVSRSAPTAMSARSSATGEGLPWDGAAETAVRPPALPPRAKSPPVIESEAPRVANPSGITALRPVVPEEPEPSPGVARSRRTAPWIVSLVAGATGAAVVAGVALVVMALRSPAPGLLVIHTNPAKASIVVDHVPHGSGPASLKLPAGSHQIDVQANGFAPFHETVVVPAGGQRIVEAALKPAVEGSPQR